MAKRKGVSSRANLLISIRHLWVTLPPFGHHASEMTLISPFAIMKENIKKEISKEIDGLGKHALQTKVPHTLYKGTHE